MSYLLMKRAACGSVIAFALSSLDGGLFAASPSPKPDTPMPIISGNRSVYLNGIDISSARSQDLRNVHIKISDSGDIYISAPQYQVTEEESFLPLSSYTSKSPLPEHKPPQAMTPPKSPGESPEKLTSKSSTGLGPETTPSSATNSPLPAQPASSSAPKTGR